MNDKEFFSLVLDLVQLLVGVILISIGLALAFGAPLIPIFTGGILMVRATIGLWRVG